MEKLSDSPFDCLAKLNNVSFAYPLKEPVLLNANLSIRRGRHILLLGANGSGKTSLLRLIRGDLLPISGQILWRDGENYSNSRIAARKIAAIVAPFQSQKCARSPLTATDILARGLPDEYSDYENSREDAAKILDSFSAADLWDKKLSDLSQGQLRLILLARALSRAAPLLLLDELADGLDATVRARVLSALEEYAARGTIMMTSHRLDAVPSFIREIYEIDSGRLRVRELTSKKARTTASVEPTAPASGRPLAKIEKANVYINGEKILRDIDWTINAGEHWRISGVNGSGKSTLCRLLAGGETVAYGGNIWRFDRAGKSLNDLSSIRKSVRLVSNKARTDYSYPLSGLDFILSGFDNVVGTYREFALEEIEEAREMARLFSLEKYVDSSIRELSAGQLARFFLARALVGSPDLLLLDEACSGLDAESRDLYLDALDKIVAGKFGKPAPSLVVISHYDSDIPAPVNRFAEMENGKLRFL